MDLREEPTLKKRRTFAGCSTNLEIFSEMTTRVRRVDKASQQEATTYFRELLSIERRPPIAKVILSGVVPRFVEFLEEDNIPSLKFDAAWALTNIASGTSEHTMAVVESGAVPIFVELIKSSHNEIREQAVWALGNVAGDSPKLRDLVLGNGALMPLLTQLNAPARPSMLKIGTWTLSNFFRGKAQLSLDQKQLALKILLQLIFIKDEEVSANACWALLNLLYLLYGTDESQALIDENICSELVKLLICSPSVLIPALRMVGRIVAGDDRQTQYIIDQQVLPRLQSLLSNDYTESIKKEACWAISNITAGNKDQIQEVIEAKIIEPLVYLLQHSKFDIQKEAAWAIANVTIYGSYTQINYLVRCGCVKPLCDLLICPDPQVVTVCLEGLENILKAGEPQKGIGGSGDVNLHVQTINEAGGLEKLEGLVMHNNTEILELAFMLLETYWLEEEVDVTDVV